MKLQPERNSARMLVWQSLIANGTVYVSKGVDECPSTSVSADIEVKSAELDAVSGSVAA